MCRDHCLGDLNAGERHPALQDRERGVAETLAQIALAHGPQQPLRIGHRFPNSRPSFLHLPLRLSPLDDLQLTSAETQSQAVGDEAQPFGLALYTSGDVDVAPVERASAFPARNRDIVAEPQVHSLLVVAEMIAEPRAVSFSWFACSFTKFGWRPYASSVLSVSAATWRPSLSSGRAQRQLPELERLCEVIGGSTLRPGSRRAAHHSREGDGFGLT